VVVLDKQALMAQVVVTAVMELHHLLLELL
jgi:hypothetical protein